MRGHSEAYRWERAKALSGWIVAVILATSLFSVVAAINPSFSTVIQPGSMVSPASFIVFKDNAGSYFAKNGTTGAMFSSGTVFATLLNTVITATPEGGGVLVRAGNYTVTQTIVMIKPMLLRGDGSQFGSGTLFYGAGANPVIKITQNPALTFHSGFRLQSIAVQTSSGGDGIQLISGQYGANNAGVIEDVYVVDKYGVGTNTGILCRGCIRNIFVNNLVSGMYQGYLFETDATDNFRSNFNHVIGGWVHDTHYGINIYDPGNEAQQGNSIDGVDFENNFIGIELSGANATKIINNWFEAQTSRGVEMASNYDIDNIVQNNLFHCTTGVVCYYEGGTRNRLLYNSFAGTGTHVAYHSGSNMSYRHGNSVGDPVGKWTSPFSESHRTLGVCPASCTSVPIVSTAYWITGGDLLIDSTGGTGVFITIQDPSGNAVVSGATTLSGVFVPWGYKITFGAFSVAPTVTVFLT